VIENKGKESKSNDPQVYYNLDAILNLVAVAVTFGAIRAIFPNTAGLAKRATARP
jgi:hypothetical protein